MLIFSGFAGAQHLFFVFQYLNLFAFSFLPALSLSSNKTLGMLRSILSRRESRGQRGSVSSNSAAPEKESELVIETKDRSLTGVVGDLGYTGTSPPPMRSL